MSHQIAEYKHERGSISVFDRGIIVRVGAEQMFLGEDFLVNFDLFCAFVDLIDLGIVQTVGGFVTGHEGQPPTERFMVYHAAADFFVLSTGEDDEQPCLGVDLAFLNLLQSAALAIFLATNPEDDTEYPAWSINGHISWTGFDFSLSEDDFEIYVPGDGGTYIFATNRMDLQLWSRALSLGQSMLNRKLPDGSWQTVCSAGTTSKVMRLECEGSRILLSLHDPELADLNVSIYLDDVAIYAIQLLLEAVWVSDDDLDDRCDICLVDYEDADEDDDGYGEGGVS